ncbi:MAG: Fpg/Nei family DNA glycosylase [Acidimicrobiales bacterium]
MPELPEVESLALFLTEQASGLVVERVDIAAISALKTFEPPIDALVGRTIDSVGRRGKFLVIGTGPEPQLYLVVHLSRGGWLRWYDQVPSTRIKPGRGPLALRVRFEGGAGFDFTEAGTEKRLAAHVVRDPADIEHVATLGIDVFDPAFTPARLGELLADRRAQIKGVLTDQRVIAGVGNAYSDEALHVARLSPFKMAAKLSTEEVGRLHTALVAVMTDAIERSKGLPAKGLKKEKKEGLRVHGRAGETCPECGDTIREVSFATKSLQYCARCQTGGKPLADRRMSRLLK